ncbi:MAG: isochorismatase family protein [Alphaproteobacteria bacterium]|nr:isochorismatase family protein [Alphaproteobacteria bacterium]
MASGLWKKIFSPSPFFRETQTIRLPEEFNSKSLHVHINIDQQREFVDPSYGEKWGNQRTLNTALHNAKIMPEIKKQGIDNCIVYYASEKMSHKKACGGLFAIRPDKRDILIKKNDNSAFNGGDIHEELQKRGKKALWVSGFNAGACVKETVIDAYKQGYEVFVMSDCVENSRSWSEDKKDEHLFYMETQGAKIVSSAQALAYFRSLER